MRSTTEKIIKKNLNHKRYDVAILGSKSSKDLDVLIVGKEYNICESFDSTSSIILLLKDIKNNFNYEVFVKHEHRRTVSPDIPSLHLLFYPSYDHLKIWEPPSFLAYIFDRGLFLFGDKRNLQKPYENYRNRKLDLNYDLTTYHLIKYSEVAITNIIYLIMDSKIYSKDIYLENLIYVLRFAFTELFVSEYPKELKINFWDWEEFIYFFEQRFPSDLSILPLFKERGRKLLTLSEHQITELFFLYLKLCDFRFSILTT